MLTREDCKKRLFTVGIKLGVSPRLIALRLLDESDKDAMMTGEIGIECLELFVRLWMAAEMPDYAKGLYRGL